MTKANRYDGSNPVTRVVRRRVSLRYRDIHKPTTIFSKIRQTKSKKYGRNIRVCYEIV